MSFITKTYKKILSNDSLTYVFQLISISCMILTIQIWQFYDFGLLSLAVFLSGVLATAICCFLAISSSIITDQFLHNMLIGFILESFALIMLLCNFFQIDIYLGHLYFVIICALVSIIFFIHVMYFANVIANLNIRKCIDKIKRANLKQVLLIGIFLCVLCIVIWPFFNIWQRWDSFTYFFSWQKLDLTNLFQSKQDGLIVCGHPASAYALLVLLFDSIPNITKINAIYLSNIFLLFIDYFVIYQIFKKILKVKSNYIHTIFAFVFICSPYILGSVTCNSPEHIGLTGLLLFLWGVMSDNYYICIISCYIVCNSRETGIPIIGMLILIQLIYDIYKIKNQSKKICSIQWLDKWIYYITVFIIGIMLVLSFFTSNWGENMHNDYPDYYYNDGTEMFGFNFSILYICNQLKGFFLTNFTWVYLIFILLTCLVAFRTDKKAIFSKLKSNSIYVMLLSGIVVSLAEICLFVTHHNYRYYTSPILFIQILGVCGFIYMNSRLKINELIRNIPVFILGLLLFVQCYITIDPVMLSLFPIINTGNAKIAVMPWNINNWPEGQFLESARYNFQVPYFDKALDVLYSKIETSNSKVLLYDGYQWGTGGGTLNSIWGHGYKFLDRPLWGVWNSEKQRRELSENPDYIIDPIPISDYTQVEKYLQEYEKLYYLELPWGDELVSDLKEKCVGMELYETIKYHGWVLNLYIF